MKLRALAFAACIACVGSVHAEVEPQSSAIDTRFQTIEYTPDIIKVKARVGRLMEIEFSPAEDKIEFAMGDREAWTVKTVGNTIYLKPKATFADTNLRVITSKRKYWFDLAMAKKKDPVAYHLSFHYPYEAPPATAVSISPELLAAQREAQEKLSIEDRLGNAHSAQPKLRVSTKQDAQNDSKPADANAPRALNGDYGVIGPDELTPTSAYDNGEITALTFAPNNPMPEVFAKEADGSEARIDFHIENDMMIIHRVARKLILRRGSAVACLINGNYNSRGSNRQTNTVSDEVVREIKAN
jgi:type IV secretion system protein VirB9